MADLRKCFSEDDLPTAFLVLLFSFSKVRILPKVTIACNVSCNGFCLFCLLHHTKAWLARYIISGTMFSHVLYYIVKFKIIALDKWLLCRALFAITQLLCHVSALCKRLLKDYYECLACIKSKQTRMIKN